MHKRHGHHHTTTHPIWNAASASSDDVYRNSEGAVRVASNLSRDKATGQAMASWKSMESEVAHGYRSADSVTSTAH